MCRNIVERPTWLHPYSWFNSDIFICSAPLAERRQHGYGPNDGRAGPKAEDRRDIFATRMSTDLGRPQEKREREVAINTGPYSGLRCQPLNKRYYTIRQWLLSPTECLHSHTLKQANGLKRAIRQPPTLPAPNRHHDYEQHHAR